MERAVDRRALLGGGIAATMAAPTAGRATGNFHVGYNASRLPATPEVYQPPDSLKAVFDLYKRMTVPVKVNGAGPYPFVADTGANQSVISADLATSLGLLAGDSQSLNGVAGVQQTATAKARIGLGGRAPRETLLAVLTATSMGAPGILGLDQLDGARLTLDFQQRTLNIDEISLPGAGDEIRVKAHRRDGQLTLVDADLAGIPVTAFLDSGAQDTIGNMALRQLAITRYPATPWRPIPIVSVTGQTINAEFADLPALRVGGLTLPNWPVAFADLHTFRLWNLIERPAILLGVDLMSRFEAICLDFRSDVVRFRLPERA